MNLKRISAIVCFSICTAYPGLAKEVMTDTLGGAKSISTTPAQLLRGEFSGVRVSATDGSPDGYLNVNIRGLNTLRGDSQPLWIVDGAIIGSTINNNLEGFYLNGGTTINGDKLPDYSGIYYTSAKNNFAWLNPYHIESIEVIKDLSATSVYGMQGANGVIIVKTRRPTTGANNVWLNSNVGVDMSYRKGDAFKTGIVTSHDLGINGVFGTNSYYSIAGFIRYDDAAVRNVGSTVGSLSVNVETMANEIFQFGLHSHLNYGNYLSTMGANFIGAPSAMMSARYPDLFPADPLSEWQKSYDDTTIDYRCVNSVWLNINFHRTLSLKLSGGIDYQNQTRYVWFGTGTSFGKKYNGATSILNNTLLNYNFNAKLSFNRSFAVRHNLNAALAVDFNGNRNSTNAMCGTDFDLPYLRGKGLSSSGSIHAIRKFSRNYSQLGAYLLAGYDFDGYAGVKAVARMDYTYGLDTKPVWLPSADAFVDLKKCLLKNVQAISSFRLSGGFGMAGKETVLPYEYIGAFIWDVPAIDRGAEPYFDGLSRIVSREYNVGFEMGLLGGRISLAVKYYDKHTKDSFNIYNKGRKPEDMWVDADDVTLYHQRLSEIRNNGFEFDGDFSLIRTSKIRWDLRVNAAYNLNRVVSRDYNDFKVAGLAKADNPEYDHEGSEYIAEFVEGLPVGQLFGYNMLPLVSGGFGTSLSLYGLTLDADFSGAGGFNIINANRLVETGRGYITAEDIERGDYLRLDCLSLSYDIPVKVRWLKDLKVSLSGHNLFTATGYSGWNPDVNCFGVNARSYGVDYGSFPMRRSVVFGISLRF